MWFWRSLSTGEGSSPSGDRANGADVRVLRLAISFEVVVVNLIDLPCEVVVDH